MFVDRRALTGESLVERDAVVRQPQQPGQPALAVLDRLAPDVLAVHLEQVKPAEDCSGVGPVPADEVEHRKPAGIADDGLPVDDAGMDGQSLDRGGDEWETVGEVVAVPAEQADAAPAPVREDAEAVVLDLVNPARARRRLAGRSRQAWFEPGSDWRRLALAWFTVFAIRHGDFQQRGRSLA